MKISFALRLFTPVLLALSLFSCSQEEPAHGIVAKVNGEPITFQRLQAAMDSRCASPAFHPGSSFEEARDKYSEALGALIVNALARQELEKKGLAPSKEDVERALERFVSDLGEENLDAFLEEIFLKKEDWKKLAADHLSMEIFRNQVLLPAIKIEFGEVKDYYMAHKKEFALPETAKACFLASRSREEIQEWCKKAAEKNFEDDSISQCVEIKYDEAPQAWEKEIRVLKPKTCGKIREEGGEWQAMALLERKPARIPELYEIYPVIEKILLNPKQAAAFDSWLENKLAASSVSINSELLNGLKKTELAEDAPEKSMH